MPAALGQERREVRQRAEPVRIVRVEQRRVTIRDLPQHRLGLVQLTQVPENQCKVLTRAPYVEVIGAERRGDPRNRALVALARKNELVEIPVQRRDVRFGVQRQLVIGAECGAQQRFRSERRLHRGTRIAGGAQRVTSAAEVQSACDRVDLSCHRSVDDALEDDRSGDATVEIEAPVVDSHPRGRLALDHREIAEQVVARRLGLRQIDELERLSVRLRHDRHRNAGIVAQYGDGRRRTLRSRRADLQREIGRKSRPDTAGPSGGDDIRLGSPCTGLDAGMSLPPSRSHRRLRSARRTALPARDLVPAATTRRTPCDPWRKHAYAHPS